MKSLGACDGVDHGAVMSTEVEPAEHEDRWVLNLRGLSVARISIDFRLTLALDAGWEVVLEAPLGSRQGHSTPVLVCL